MDTNLRLKVAMALRVRDFLVAHPLGTAPADQLSAEFGAKVERAQLLFARQESGAITSRSGVQLRRTLRAQMLTLPLRHLVKIARAVAASNPGVAGGIKRPAFGRSEALFQADVQALVETVKAHQDLFLAKGMAENCLAELDQSLKAYGQAVQDANAGRREHTGARAELFQVVKELMQAVVQLDAIVLYQLRDKPDLMGAWTSARNVAWPALTLVKSEKPAA